MNGTKESARLDIAVDPASSWGARWTGGDTPSLEELREAAKGLSGDRLVSVLRTDQFQRWERGDAVGVEAYLRLFDSGLRGAEDHLELICGEMMLLGRTGKAPDATDLQARFPAYAEVIGPMLELHDVFCNATTTAFESPCLDSGAKRSAESLPCLDGYEVIEKVGEGGMGVVYRARHLRLSRIVALKRLRADFDEEHWSRLRREAMALAKVAHPNVVQIFDFGESDGRPWLSLEFLPEGSLDQLLAGRPQHPLSAAACSLSLARAMAAVHAAGILHRDLKPANILIARRAEPSESKGPPTLDDFEPKITDFGLARDVEDVQTTTAGRVMGTPAYMAPEQAAGEAEAIGPATDVYALGVVLYEMLVGSPPFRAPTQFARLMLVRTAEPVAPRMLQPGVPRDLETICLKCLEKSPARRYASAAELAEDLTRFLENRPILAKPPSIWDRAVKFVRRHRTPVAGAAATFAALLAGIIGVSLALVRTEAAEREKGRSLVLAKVRLLRLNARTAESLAHQADLHLQRGEYEQALSAVAESMAMGHPERARLRLARIRAYISLNRHPELNAELAELPNEPDYPSREGEVLIARADAVAGIDDEAARRLFRSAGEKELPEAAREYALGMLADGAEPAAEHFRKAVALDPLDLRARHMLMTALFLLGRGDEVRRHLEVSRALFPNDTHLALGEAVAEALAGDRKSARKRIRSLAGRWQPSEIRMAEELVDVFGDLADVDLWCFGDARRMQVNAHLPRLILLMRQSTNLPATASQSAVGPPFVAEQFRPLIRTVLASGGMPGFADWERELSRMSKSCPEGMLLLSLGMVQRHRGGLAEAEATFAKSAACPSLFCARRAALYARVLCLRELHRNDSSRRPVLLGTMRELAAERDLPADPYLSKLTEVALELKEYDFAQDLVAAWARRTPGSPEVRTWRKRLADGLAARPATASIR